MEPSVEGFWAYCRERHLIWYRRFIQKQSWPWTEDSVLRQYRFCNVKRELDRGTRWYLENVALGQLWPDLIFRTVLYRLVNNADWFEEVGGVPSLEGWAVRRKETEKNWRSRMTFPPGSPAYLVFGGAPAGRSHLDSLLLIADKLADNWWRDYCKRLQAQPTLQEFWQQLQEIYGVGPFVAMQVYLDLFSAGVLGQFTPDDFTYIGPGAAPIIERLRGRTDPYKWILQLRDSQITESEEIEQERLLRFHLNDIQFNLCEYRKFVNLSNGIGKKRRYVQDNTERRHLAGVGAGEGSVRASS